MFALASVRWREKERGQPYPYRDTHTLLSSPLSSPTYPDSRPLFLSCHAHLTSLHQLSRALLFPTEGMDSWTGSELGTHTPYSLHLSGCSRSRHISPHHHPVTELFSTLCGLAGLSCFTDSAETVYFGTESHSSLSILL